MKHTHLVEALSRHFGRHCSGLSEPLSLLQCASACSHPARRAANEAARPDHLCGHELRTSPSKVSSLGLFPPVMETRALFDDDAHAARRILQNTLRKTTEALESSDMEKKNNCFTRRHSSPAAFSAVENKVEALVK